MKKIVNIVLSLTIIISLSGCFQKKDVDRLTLVTAIGIDSSENGFKLSAQVMNPFAMGDKANNVAPFIVVSSEGQTVLEALRKLTNTFPSKLFLSHFQMLVFGEEIAKDGIAPYLDFFITDHETQHKFNVIVVKNNTAESVLKIQTMMNKISTESVLGKIESAFQSYGTSIVTSTLDDVINKVKADNYSLTLPSVQIEGNADLGKKNQNVESTTMDALITTSDIAIFKNDQLKGWLNNEETQGYNHILGDLQSSVLSVPLEKNQYVSFEIFKTKSTMKVRMDHGLPHITVQHTISGGVGEITSGTVSYTDEFMAQVEKKVQELVAHKMEKVIEVSQNTYNADIFGFSGLLHRKETKYYNKIKDHYDTVYPKFIIDVEVKVKINRIRK